MPNKLLFTAANPRGTTGPVTKRLDIVKWTVALAALTFSSAANASTYLFTLAGHRTAIFTASSEQIRSSARYGNGFLIDDIGGYFSNGAQTVDTAQVLFQPQNWGGGFRATPDGGYFISAAGSQLHPDSVYTDFSFTPGSYTMDTEGGSSRLTIIDVTDHTVSLFTLSGDKNAVFAITSEQIRSSARYGNGFLIGDVGGYFSNGAQTVDTAQVLFQPQNWGGGFRATPDGGYFISAAGSQLHPDSVYTDFSFTPGSYTMDTEGGSAQLTIKTLYDGQAVAAVPEPTTWAMMIVGFGAIGGAMRRHRRALVRFV